MLVINLSFLVLWLGLIVAIALVTFDFILTRYSIAPPTANQFSAFVLFFTCWATWLYQELYQFFESKVGPYIDNSSAPYDQESTELIEHQQDSATSSSVSESGCCGVVKSDVPQYMFKCLPDLSNFISLSYLRSLSEFSAIMTLVYLTDRTDLLRTGEKIQSMDVFWFVYACIVVSSLCSMRTSHTAPDIASNKLGSTGILQREQTEEWKGWMQVLFLLYHYFVATEIYNAIRLFIAAYIWMTGFGNFSYYYIRQNFGISRFCQMMWRLNFLVIVCCVVLNNDYMCYYICPLHTLWTLLIYVSLGIKPQINKSFFGISFKFVFLFALVLVVWDVAGVWDAVFGPFHAILKYKNPHTQSDDDMQEWRFRSRLDRFVWIFGMLCAYNFPNIENVTRWVERGSAMFVFVVKSVVVVLLAVAWYFYYTSIYTLPKKEYNAVHPYTSFIPITIYIIARNLTPTLRSYHGHLFEWLGKITLETYILQYHVWLKTEHPNYQPKKTLVLFENHPLVNFMFCSLTYIFLSHRIFHLTNKIKELVIPQEDSKVAGSLLKSALIVTTVFLCGWGLHALHHVQ